MTEIKLLPAAAVDSGLEKKTVYFIFFDFFLPNKQKFLTMI